MDLTVLRRIADTPAGVLAYVSQAEGLPLVQHNPPLIAVDGGQKDPADATRIAAQLTDAGKAMLNGGNAQAQSQASTTKPIFEVEKGAGFVPAKVSRGGGFGGAPNKYPFETMEINDLFFVGDTEVEKGDAFKTLSSAVGSANQRFAEETGENKTVNRAKRGSDNKAIKGPDGKNIMETVTIPVKKATKKFIARKVEGGKQYGTYTAPANGAVAVRVPLD